MKLSIKHMLVVGAAMAATSPALAQTGDELIGQTVDVVFSDGTANSVYFDQNGGAVINGGGGQIVNARWLVNGDKLCLQTAASNECWAYSSRFEAGRTQLLNSSCNETSNWTARSVNPIRQEVAPVLQGERG